MPQAPYPPDATIADAFWNAPVGLFETDTVGRCVRVNRRWCELTGVSHEQGLVEGWLSVVHPDDRMRVYSGWINDNPGDEDFVIDLRYVRPTGDIVHAHVRAARLTDDVGNITGYTGMVMEAGAIGRVPAAIPPPSLGMGLFDNAPLGIQIFNSRGTSLMMNERQRAHLGVPTTSTGVGSFNLLTDPFTRDSDLTRAFLRALNGETVELPAALVDYSQGKHWDLAPGTRWIERTLFPIAMEKGENAVVLIVRDVSARVRSSEALKAAETRFRQVFEAAGDGIALVSADYKGVLANPAFEAIVGAAPGGLEGFNMLALFADEEEMDLIGTDLATTNSSRRNMLARRVDGSTFHAATHFVNLFDDQGTLTGVLVVARDISERLQSRLAIEASERYLRDIIDGLRTMVYVFEEDEQQVLRCTHANRRTLRALQLSREQIVGSLPRDVLGDEWGIQLEAQVRQAADTGETIEQERVRDLESGTRIFQTRAIPVVDEVSQRVRVICETRDLTEVRKNQRLAEDHARLVSLSTLAAGVAHDFNNLLQSILLGTELATDAAPANWDGLEILRDVRSSTLRAADLATKMLAFSGQAPLRPGYLTLRWLGGSIMASLADSVPPGVHLVTDFLDPEAAISGDGAQLARAITGIIMNAAEAATADSEVRVTFGTAVPSPMDIARAYPPGSVHQQQYACIEVRDSGTGIEPGTLARIFEPFFSTKFAGRGLGLSAALGVIRGHGGGIIVDSEVGAGTCMRIFLPLLDEQASEAAA